jgi:hypothetical protein
LARPFVIDTATIDSRDGEELELLIQAIQFFDLPPQLETAAKGAADYQTYCITVQDGTRSHEVRLTDPIEDARLERLVSLLQGLARP